MPRKDYGSLARTRGSKGRPQEAVHNPFSVAFFRALPIVALAAWLSTLVGLLVMWAALDEREMYKRYIGAVPFISDVGAVHKSYFMATALITAIFYSASLIGERYLRSRRVLVEATQERLLLVTIGTVDVFVGIIGSTALVLLSTYDAFSYGHYHSIFMNTFILSVAVSGLLQTIEVEHLWHEHPDRHDLMESAMIKWIVLTIAIACGAGFWILYAVCDGDASRNDTCYRIITASAILEWAACFLCAGYLATLIIDLWPAYRHAPIIHQAWASTRGIEGFVINDRAKFAVVAGRASASRKM